jgi:hypothetical protein
MSAYVGPDGLPLEYMLAVMRDPAVDPRRRDRMAELAAPYCHHRLSLRQADGDAPKVPAAASVRRRVGKKEVELEAARNPDRATAMGALLARRRGGSETAH